MGRGSVCIGVCDRKTEREKKDRCICRMADIGQFEGIKSNFTYPTDITVHDTDTYTYLLNC